MTGARPVIARDGLPDWDGEPEGAARETRRLNPDDIVLPGCDHGPTRPQKRARLVFGSDAGPPSLVDRVNEWM